MDAWAAIDLSVCMIDALNALTQLSIFLAPSTGSALPPGVVSTLRDLQHTAQDANRIVLLLHCNELVFHLDSREKMLTPFFKMSRSCLVTSSSRLRRRTSSSWAV